MSVRSSLLALLEGGPSYGYQLRTEFEQLSRGAWAVNIGQVYSTLDRLERDGLVTAGERTADGQQFYAITEPGRATVRAWFDEPVLKAGGHRDELAMKIALAVERGEAEVRHVIQVQRSATMRVLQDMTRAKLARDEGGDADDLAAALVLESMIFQVEAEARWLDYAESAVMRRAGR